MAKTWIAFILALTAALAAGPALAWDAGPKQCKHDVCSGGVDANSFADTQPAYANSVIPGRLADCPAGYSNIGIAGCGRGADSISTPSKLADCPSGYTNMGLTCFRGAHSYGNYCKGGCAAGYTNTGCTCFRGADTQGASSMVCPAGYFKDDAVKRCHKNCPAGYTQMGESCFRGVDTMGPSSFKCNAGEHRGGGLNANKCFPNPGPCSADREEYGVSGASLCFSKCPAGSRRTAISTCTHDVKWRGNTHLYVVRNALALLASSSDPVAQKAYKTMSAEPCKTQWEDGLWDADDPDGALVDRPDSSSKGGGTHFYNASGKDIQGKPTRVVTYLLAGVEANFKGNARQQAVKYLPAVAVLNGTPSNDQCHSRPRAALRDRHDAADARHGVQRARHPDDAARGAGRVRAEHPGAVPGAGLLGPALEGHDRGQRLLPDLPQVGDDERGHIDEAGRLQGNDLHDEPGDGGDVHRHVLRERARGGQRHRCGAAGGLPVDRELHLRGVQPGSQVSVAAGR